MKAEEFKIIVKIIIKKQRIIKDNIKYKDLYFIRRNKRTLYQ